ncbi:MAG: hypothetical protein IKU26_06915 [Clostridia bacterium]|nr:hypothetical protein [Clostridia bacterium]
MIDPTSLNEQLRNAKKKPSMAYRRTFGSGLLGGLMGGLIFLAFKGFGSIDCFPIFILSGIGVMAMYLYFVDRERRDKRQLPVLFLAGLAAVLITLFFYIILSLYKTGAGVTAGHIFDAYFRNSSESAIDGTLLFHLVACFFTALGIGGSWLYVSISTPKWENKHGASEPVRRSKSKRKR